MFQIDQSVKSKVIQGYLNGKPRDQIATELGISTGKTSGIIKEWVAAIGMPDVEELREFAVTLRKSGLSLKQCTDGFRVHQMLNNLGIGVETSEKRDEQGEDFDPNREIISFIDGIFLACKNRGITPSNVLSWISDLLDCYPSLLPFETGIPFVSQVSNYIAQKKKEYRMLEENKQDLIKEIDTIDKKKDKAEQNLNQLDLKGKSAMVYLKWYYELKRVLWDTYGINIDDVKEFAKLMYDFKNNG